MPAPDHVPSGGELVEQGRAVCRHAAGQHKRLQRAGRQDRSGQLLDGTQDALGTTQTGADSLPGGQETGQIDGRNGLDLGPKCRERAPTKGAQNLGVAEVGAVDSTTGLDREQLALNDPT